MTRLEDLVAESVLRHPKQTAVEDPSGQLTYDQLWRQALGLAAELRRRGVRRLALRAPSSRDSIALYLGTLVAGATVVPLGAASPPPRTASAIRTAAVDLVVAGAPGPPVEGRPVVSIDELLGQVASAPRAGRDGDPEDTAYIIFTSGSTGSPKGVPITHENALAFVAAAARRFALGPGDRVSQFFDLSFDVSVFDIFSTLAAGATLVVPTQSERLRPVEWVTRRRLTHWAGVPSSVSLAVRSGDLEPGVMPHLRRSMFIGERLTLQLAELWSAAAPGSEVVNFYGPAEATVAVSSYTLPRDARERVATRNGSVPIGTMFEGVEWRVVPVPGRDDRDPAGELHLRGSQVFAGYLGSADQGADGEPSVPDVDGWYRTSDVVELVGDELVHLGRLDDQVKVGGYRVELGDVETHLREVAGILEAVVTVGHSPSGAALHAFYVGDELSLAGVRRSLSSALPHYMLPVSVTRVDGAADDAFGQG